MIYSLKTTSGREDTVVDIISTKIKSEALEIKAVVHPAELKGYVFIEGNSGDIHKAIQGMLHVKGLMDKPINLNEIQRFFESKKVVVDEGDEVEIVGGAFKGDRGIITRLDKTKEEVTIELKEGSIPIPVTIAIEFVKLIKKGKLRQPENKSEEDTEKRESILEQVNKSENAPKKFSFEDLKRKLSGAPEKEESSEDISPDDVRKQIEEAPKDKRKKDDEKE